MTTNIKTLVFMSKLANLMAESDTLEFCGEIQIVDKTTQDLIFNDSDLNDYLKKFKDSLIGYAIFDGEKIQIRYSFENREIIRCIPIISGQVFYIPYKDLLKE